MNDRTLAPNWNAPARRSSAAHIATHRVLRNTYALLAMTLGWAAAVATAGVAFDWRHPGPIVSLLGTLCLFFVVHKLRNSGWALPAVFALTGFMGYTLGPVLNAVAGLPGGAASIAMALGTTGVTFLGLSAFVLVTRKDFSFMGGFLMIGMIVALVAGLAALFLEIPALSLAVSAAVALLSAGLILFETSRIVQGGETNYVMATVGLFLSVYNLFVSLLSLFGFSSAGE
ncbi:Bax inhibitor-1/YccA family protein [Inhella crocodyli]|uniref:Bax inhibitor-1/YccA family protein n=1 Tax=Inhella crocodyli TaxID=2499851 RepID=A0A3S2XYZ7_9BURK|nr:Bax inhibitor-1/YccA family protein [Inhella crocodyli]RVT88043.1 Bax inhibitor-1/YccA family protein [Inhella crocodyli]